jgi:hypothetical protein
MAESAAIVRSFRVGKRICTLTVQQPRPGGFTNIVAEWNPGLPDRPFTAKEIRQYRAGRDVVAAELAAQLGGAALVIEA